MQIPLIPRNMLISKLDEGYLQSNYQKMWNIQPFLGQFGKIWVLVIKMLGFFGGRNPTYWKKNDAIVAKES